ncbi:hypothetical protein ACQJBY_034449 [Aegilops geniculata]
MGKYMRKSKASGEVAVMEVAGALLGVRTRSRTLAAQQQRAPSPSPSPSPHPQRKGQEDGDYLELRSRRLEKQPPPGPKEKEDAPQPAARRAAAAAGGRRTEQAPSFAADGFEADLEVSFGDNVLDWDAGDRGARETTPCSLIYSSETMSTPGSATGARNPSRRRAQTPACRYVPSSLEMDEFFAAAEQQQHQSFREK